MHPRRLAGAWERGFGDRPDLFLISRTLGVEAWSEDARDQSRDVRVHECGAALEREAGHRARRVCAYAWQPAQRLGVGGERRATARRTVAPRCRALTHHRSRESVEVARAGVVAESLPGGDDVGLACVGQHFERGKSLQETRVELHHTRDLSLLEHQLRDEDVIRVPRVAPRQVARVALVPGAEASAEGAPRGWVEAWRPGRFAHRHLSADPKSAWQRRGHRRR